MPKELNQTKKSSKRKINRQMLSLMQASVKLANFESNLNLLNIISDLLFFHTTMQTFKIDCFKLKDCSIELFNWMMTLLEENMSSLYRSTEWGWDLDSKRTEMSEDNARFIIAFNEVNNKPVAFSHFRFDMDNAVSVVYCYELQLDKSFRKLGLGKHIMTILERLCHNFNLRKVVLTVFNHNSSAFQFFKSQGYVIDETSPQNYSIKTFYSILSKNNMFYSIKPTKRH